VNELGLQQLVPASAGGQPVSQSAFVRQLPQVVVQLVPPLVPTHFVYSGHAGPASTHCPVAEQVTGWLKSQVGLPGAQTPLHTPAMPPSA
jgi:hypothetical protein